MEEFPIRQKTKSRSAQEGTQGTKSENKVSGKTKTRLKTKPTPKSRSVLPLNTVLDAVGRYFKREHFHYKRDKEEKSALITAIDTAYGGSVVYNIFFMEAYDSSCEIRAYNLITYTDAVETEMYQACSCLNATYRWAKFYLNEANHTVWAECDVALPGEEDELGETVMHYLMLMANIIDEARKVLVSAAREDDTEESPAAGRK